MCGFDSCYPCLMVNYDYTIKNKYKVKLLQRKSSLRKHELNPKSLKSVTNKGNLNISYQPIYKSLGSVVTSKRTSPVNNTLGIVSTAKQTGVHSERLILQMYNLSLTQSNSIHNIAKRELTSTSRKQLTYKVQSILTKESFHTSNMKLTQATNRDEGFDSTHTTASQRMSLKQA